MLGLDACLKEIPREALRHVSSRPDQSQSAQARMPESRAERSVLAVSLRGARHSSSRRWLVFSESQNLAAESHEQANH